MKYKTVEFEKIFKKLVVDFHLMWKLFICEIWISSDESQVMSW